MALYEVVNKERFNAAQKKELARLSNGTPEPAQPVQPIKPVSIPPQQSKKSDAAQNVWMKKPSMFSFNNGRVEVFIPYPIAITIVMGLALLLVVSFRIGQGFGKSDGGEIAVATSSETTVSVNDTAKVAKEMARSSVSKRQITPVQASASAVAGSAKGGDYVVVLAELKNATSARDMEPAKQYFDEQGIATEIKNVRGSYFLVTTERYDGFGRGTSGYDVIEKIKQVGAKYKVPAGYGGFGSKPFSDAYGRKM